MNRSIFLASLVAVSLLGASCQSKPGKHNLTGVWKAECSDKEIGRRFDQDYTFYENKTFEHYRHLRYGGKQFSSHSGSYENNSENLILTYRESDFPDSMLNKPYYYSLNWIDSNTVEIRSENGNTKCNAYRQNST